MNIDAFIEGVRAHKPIDENEFVRVLRKAGDILFCEFSLLKIPAPVTVCGDVHGQFYDLLRLFETGGAPGTTRYLFLGDYVDRGYFSIETIALLLAYKVKYPDTFFLIRGNHECRQVNTLYGFYDEVVQRFGHPGPWKLCNEIFDLLPMAALIEEKVFCDHGGLSPQVKLVDQVALFERRAEIPGDGPVSDLCWSDPDQIEGWGVNQRGAGYLFGTRPTTEFVHNNKLNFIARAHQIAMEGYQWHFDRKLVTVWSAPNYMYRSGNLASVMYVGEDLQTEFKIFEAVPNDQRVIPDANTPEYFA